MYVTELTRFYTAVKKDERVTSNHVLIYLALFQLWNLNEFITPVSITRKEVMLLAKMGRVSTYHKCIRELTAFGYIDYVPSYHPKLGSLICLHHEPAKKEE